MRKFRVVAFLQLVREEKLGPGFPSLEAVGNVNLLVFLRWQQRKTWIVSVSAEEPAENLNILVFRKLKQWKTYFMEFCRSKQRKRCILLLKTPFCPKHMIKSNLILAKRSRYYFSSVASHRLEFIYIIFGQFHLRIQAQFEAIPFSISISPSILDLGFISQMRILSFRWEDRSQIRSLIYDLDSLIIIKEGWSWINRPESDLG